MHMKEHFFSKISPMIACLQVSNAQQNSTFEVSFFPCSAVARISPLNKRGIDSFLLLSSDWLIKDHSRRANKRKGSKSSTGISLLPWSCRPWEHVPEKRIIAKINVGIAVKISRLFFYSTWFGLIRRDSIS